MELGLKLQLELELHVGEAALYADSWGHKIEAQRQRPTTPQ